MNAGRIDKDYLRIRIAADAHHLAPRGLRLGRDDRDLMPDDMIDQGRFSDVRAPAEDDESGAMLMFFGYEFPVRSASLRSAPPPVRFASCCHPRRCPIPCPRFGCEW